MRPAMQTLEKYWNCMHAAKNQKIILALLYKDWQASGYKSRKLFLTGVH